MAESAVTPMVKGSIYTVLSTLLYASSGVLLKYLRPTSSYQIAALRQTIEYLAIAPVTIYKIDSSKLVPGGPILLKLLSLGFVDALCFYSRIKSLDYVSLGVGATFYQVGWIISVLLAHSIFKERVDRYGLLLMFVSMIGVVLITKPGTSLALSAAAISWSLMQAFTAAMQSILWRMCTDVTNSFVVQFYFVFIGLLTWWPCTFATGLKVINLNQLGMIVVLAIAGYSGQFLTTVACSKGSMLVVQVSLTCEILFGFVYDIVLFSHTPDWYEISGALCIVFAVIGIMYRKQKR